MRGVTDLAWPGGEHDFVLGIGELRALQDKCDAGPAHVLARLQDGTWRIDDLIQPLRLGLVGAGMDKVDARNLVEKHLDETPLTRFVLPASMVLMASLFGPDEGDADSPGEPDAGKASAIPSPAAKSDGRRSTETAPSSDSRRDRSIN